VVDVCDGDVDKLVEAFVDKRAEAFVDRTFGGFETYESDKKTLTNDFDYQYHHDQHHHLNRLQTINHLVFENLIRR
ncbi:unnamed protein product, partial [Rotaria magnacalcarata]